jgi:hypothetical protein
MHNCSAQNISCGLVAGLGGFGGVAIGRHAATRQLRFARTDLLRSASVPQLSFSSPWPQYVPENDDFGELWFTGVQKLMLVNHSYWL